MRGASDTILYRLTVLSSSRRRNLPVKVPLSTSGKIVKKNFKVNVKKYLKISGVKVTGVPARTSGTSCNGEKNRLSN